VPRHGILRAEKGLQLGADTSATPTTPEGCISMEKTKISRQLMGFHGISSRFHPRNGLRLSHLVNDPDTQIWCIETETFQKEKLYPASRFLGKLSNLRDFVHQQQQPKVRDLQYEFVTM